MAIPVIPLLLIGAGVLVFRKRRRTAKKTTEPEPLPGGPIQTLVFIPPEDREPPKRPSEQPGQPCETAEGQGAWDEQSECKTFWIDGETDEAIRRLAREEWEARGQPSFSELCLAVYDQTSGELGTHEANPRFTEIVVAALQRYYGTGAVFPPTEANAGHLPTSPYWVHEAWARAHRVIHKELCGG